MKSFTKVAALAVVLSAVVVPYGFAMEEVAMEEVEKKDEVLPWVYYPAQLAGGLASVAIGNELLKGARHDLEFDDAWQEYPAAVLLAAGLSLVLIYKVPQWIDTWLGVKEERSGGCNVSCFAAKILLGSSYMPLGATILATELIKRQYD